jgi:hypothetical protein
MTHPPPNAVTSMEHAEERRICDAGRFIGLDVHKHYLVVVGVDAELNVVLPAQRVDFARLGDDHQYLGTVQ